MPEPSLSLVLSKYREAIASMERVVWQETTDYPTGQVTGEVSVTPVPDEDGRCCQLLGVVHDLTKEKQVEKALRISNERLAYALKATTDAIYDWTISDDSLYWGEGFENLFGYQLAQNPMPFSEWADYVHPDDSPRVVAGLRHAAFETTNLFWQEEYRFRRANGTWAEVFDRGYLLRDAAGRAVRMMGAMQDITSRKQAEGFSNCICTFQSAQEALDKLVSKKQRVPQIIFLDLNMPIMDGWQFLDALAPYQDALRGTCHIYILTSSLALKDLEKSRHYDLVADLIHKPVDSKEIRVIQSLFEYDEIVDDEPCDC
ncbi:PAS domain-containing protein [Hymenobacter siberiensis]|uniref:PAS domain-containing protein n=1 Tax=Hymenobacter siberiensis TaxID=2848396 RepID=UPI001D01C725